MSEVSSDAGVRNKPGSLPALLLEQVKTAAKRRGITRVAAARRALSIWLELLERADKNGTLCIAIKNSDGSEGESVIISLVH